MTGKLYEMTANLGGFVTGIFAAALSLFSIAMRTFRGVFRFRGRAQGEVLKQMYLIGNRSLIFVTVTLGALGMVLVFQVCLQINKITGDQSQVGPEFIKGMIHAFVPILTAMMLATRVGAGIAAETGSMVVTEQIDALRMTGVDPVDFILVPRFIASVVMTFVLGVYAMVIVIVAGAFMAHSSFGVNYNVFFVFDKVTGGDLFIGSLKLIVHGGAIPIVAGYCGLTTGRGSEGVGNATTRAVINSSLAVIIIDFIISGVGLLTVQKI
ncbi:ABC transporter permease [Myxococcota bacterium]|nr:ABC transporter permease [Myxococcota bacterium]MBU1381707.1 ABC transporter permease [Myxococcota bacterium]MBU1497485.1 ABC transporter permease [Myxococcota bacterium]